MRLQDAKKAAALRDVAPPAVKAKAAPSALSPLARAAMLMTPAPFFWNPPAWVIALTNPATARAASFALAACHPWLAPEVLRILRSGTARGQRR